MDLEGIDDGLRVAREWSRERSPRPVLDQANTAGTERKPAALNPTRFINRQECRNFLMQFAEENRTHKFDRVSGQTLLQLNEVVRAAMIGHVKRLPSKGKTI